jgi:predicted transport protein
MRKAMDARIKELEAALAEKCAALTIAYTTIENLHDIIREKDAKIKKAICNTQEEELNGNKSSTRL